MHRARGLHTSAHPRSSRPRPSSPRPRQGPCTNGQKGQPNLGAAATPELHLSRQGGKCVSGGWGPAEVQTPAGGSPAPSPSRSPPSLYQAGHSRSTGILQNLTSRSGQQRLGKCWQPLSHRSCLASGFCADTGPFRGAGLRERGRAPDHQLQIRAQLSSERRGPDGAVEVRQGRGPATCGSGGWLKHQAVSQRPGRVEGAADELRSVSAQLYVSRCF